MPVMVTSANNLDRSSEIKDSLRWYGVYEFVWTFLEDSILQLQAVLVACVILLINHG